MGIVTKAAACSAVLVAMVIAGVLSHRRPVVQFHQYPGFHHQQTRFTPEHLEDRGYIKNCGHSGPSYFNVSWSPKQISPLLQVTIYASVVSPVYFEKGKIAASIWYEGNIMVSIKKEIRCEEIVKEVEHILPPHTILLTCPLKKGQLLKGRYVFSNTESLIGYDGHYRLKAQLWNDQGEELVCIDLEMDVLPFE